jgi:hypothetical protein
MPNKPKRLGRTRKSDRIPEHYSLSRRGLNSLLLDSPEYKKCLKKGLPFFSKSQLKRLQNKYHKGITWKEIDTELSKKGMIFNKATFRKYIREKNIPHSIGYKTYEKGREAIYPPKVIEHINFTQYFYRVADDKQIIKLLELLTSITINGKEAVESKLLDTGNIFSAVKDYISDMSTEGEDICEAIQDVFRDDPDFADELIRDLQNLHDTFWKKYDQITEKLKKYEVPGITIEESKAQNEKFTD